MKKIILALGLVVGQVSCGRSVDTQMEVALQRLKEVQLPIQYLPCYEVNMFEDEGFIIELSILPVSEAKYFVGDAGLNINATDEMVHDALLSVLKQLLEKGYCGG